MKLRITRRESRIEQIVQALPAKADQALRALGSEIVSDVKLSFGESPSAPGGPPGVDTGALRASIRLQPDGTLRYLVMDGVEYGLYLELGTEFMSPRPFMGPVFEDWRGRFPAFLRDQGLV